MADVIVEVGARDVETIYDEAIDWSDPDLGLLTVSVPPMVTRLTDLLRPLLAALGATALRRPASGEAQAVESSLARLRAHEVHSVILLHGHWLPATVFGDLVAAAALVDINLFILVHPDDETEEVVADWRTAVWGWDEMRAWVTDHAAEWRAAGSDPVRHQRVAMPDLGLSGSVQAVPPGRPGEGVADRVFSAIRRRVPVAPPLHLVASIVRQELRAIEPADMTRAIGGAATALAEAGFDLLRGAMEERPTEWRALRGIADVTSAAAVALVAIGLDDKACSRLTCEDVDIKSSIVVVGGRAIPIPPAAIPYLAAQHYDRAGSRGAFLEVNGRAAGPTAVRGLVNDGLRAIGHALEDRNWDRGISMSQRWLIERGLLVRRTRDADVPRLPEERDDVRVRRCRHGITAWIDVDGDERVSHSQALCRATEIDEARPMSAGYSVEVLDTSGTDVGYEVRTPERGLHGALWRVQTALGGLWVQSLARRRPSTVDVGVAVRRAQLTRTTRLERSR